MQRLLAISLCSSLAMFACGNDKGLEPASAADRFPRLSHAQWEATVHDLFGLSSDTGLASMFTPDPQLGRFDNNIARLSITPGLWRDYQNAAEQIASRVVGDAELYGKLIGDATTAQDFITRFGLRAFRRPLTPAEVERYAQLFDTAAPIFPEHDAFHAGVRFVVQSMLQSPFFLYRSELKAVKEAGAMPLGGYEVASRLSYLFWNTMPDDGLFSAAQSGALDTSDGIREQALRMFDDPRAQAQFRRFHYQAFSISEYADLDKNKTKFPTWKKELGPMMQEEALRFFENVVSHDGGVAELLTSNKAFVNADLAKIYGLSGSFDDAYQEVELDPATRAGLLTRAGFLARNATLEEPDPIHRGVFINIDILCRPISAPPNIPQGLPRTGNTNREKVTSITGPGTCGENCHHTIINPLGFAFEGFDAIGATRADDNGFPLDTTGTYHFADGHAISYDGAVDLSRQLSKSPEVHQCYATQLAEFMLGRDLTLQDKAMINALSSASANHASIKELVIDFVSSNAFRARAVERSQP